MLQLLFVCYFLEYLFDLLNINDAIVVRVSMFEGFNQWRHDPILNFCVVTQNYVDKFWVFNFFCFFVQPIL